MVVLFLLPFYVVVSIAFGTVDPVFQSPLPVYEPWWWTSRYLREEWHLAIGEFRAAAARTTNLREQQYLTTKAARLARGGRQETGRRKPEGG